MAVTLEQFVQHLTQSGLMSASEVSSFQDSLPIEKQAKDGETLARALVQANKLTKYQAQLVYQGKVKGLVFGDYRVLDKLGQGGMGLVLKAEHRRMERTVAVKMISASHMKSPRAVQRFYREVKAAARLNHSNIVTAYDACEHDGVHYLMMEYVDGKDLAAIVKERGPLPVSQAVDYMIQAAKGLQFAHEQGIVHRDIKPSNLLVDKKGTVKILDMGLARVSGLTDDDDNDRLTASGQVMGTLDYMAPEQALDTHHADARADIYSLGCTLYRLMTGEVLFKCDTLAKIIWAHQQAPIPSLSRVRGDVSPQLEATYQKMVAKKPEDRPQSMAQVIAELEACAGKQAPSSTLGNDEPTTDLAMEENLSFLKNASRRTLATGVKKKGEKLPEATLSEQMSPAEDSKEFASNEGPLAILRKKRALAIAVGLGVIGVVGIAWFAITIRIRHADDRETVVQVPEGSNVEISDKGDVRVTLNEPPTGAKWPAFKGQGSRDRGQGSGDRGQGGGEKGQGGGEKTTPLARAAGEGQGVRAAPSPAIAPFDATKAKAHQENWAKHLGIPVEQTNSIGMKFVLIPPGEFDMGSTPEEQAWAVEKGQAWLKKKGKDAPENYSERFSREGPRHRVKITKPFRLGIYLVTQGEYEKVIGRNPSTYCANQVKVPGFNLSQMRLEERRNATTKLAGKDTSRHPVEMVSWTEAMEFCRQLSETSAERTAGQVYRLPTEAEWEYACRAGTTTPWSYGDAEAELRQYAWFEGNAFSMTHPVGEKLPNPWGLFDMHGTVLEWCGDWLTADYYGHSPSADPPGPPDGTERVLRGGRSANMPVNCRSACREGEKPGNRMGTIGFRVVAEIVPKSEIETRKSETPKAQNQPPQSPSPIPNPQSPIPPPPVAPFDATKAKAHQENWAKHLGVPVEQTNSIGMKLVLIPPGEFDMGSTPEEQAWVMKAGNEIANEKLYHVRVSSEGPRHRVKITKPFRLGMYHVTQSEYEQVIGANPSGFTEKQMEPSAFKPLLDQRRREDRQRNLRLITGKDTTRHPVDSVTWDEAAEFCRKLSALPAERTANHVYRLPTEAEWEYACRAGTTTRWYYGDDEAGLTDVAWIKKNAGGITHPVGQKRPNAWSLYDMYGNVNQWCADWFSPDYYSHSPANDPVGQPTGDRRVLRGGYFFSVVCWSAYRGDAWPYYRHHSDGFRVVVEIAPNSEIETRKSATPKAQNPPPQSPSPIPNPQSLTPPPPVAPFDDQTAKAHQENWAKHLGVPVEQTNSIGMKFVLIPPGEFDMGSTPEEQARAMEVREDLKDTASENYRDQVSSEGPRHRVKITKPFCLGMYHVTQSEYEQVIGVNPSGFTEKQMEPSAFKPLLDQTRRKDREWDLKRIAGKDTTRNPVDSITWNEAAEFCRKLSALPAERTANHVYRLPTEAEWEYACRSGTTTRWYYGDDEAGLTDVAWVTKNARGITHPVGQKRPNAWGLYDMCGNVQQWCEDWFTQDYYSHSPANDPVGHPTGDSRVLRGNYFNSVMCWSAFRGHARPYYRHHSIGFRVVVEVMPKSEIETRKAATPKAQNQPRQW